MIEYSVFKSVIAQRIRDYLPPVFQTWEPQIRQVTKVNEIKDGFNLLPPDLDKRRTCVPTVYLDEIYMDFARDEDLDRVLQGIASVIVAWTGKFTDALQYIDPAAMEDQIFMQLIGSERNGQLLEQFPHCHVMDLSVIFRVLMGKNENSCGSFLLSYDMMEKMELDTEELLDLAMANTRRLFPARIIPADKKCVFMTNDSGICGATTMLYEESMRQLAEYLGGDFYVLPSSIHEVVAVPAACFTADALARLVSDANRSVVDAADRLSDSVYLYQSRTESLMRCR